MSLSSFCKGDEWVSHLKRQTVVTYGTKNELKSSNILKFSISPQPVFHKNFELLEANLLEKIQDAYDIGCELQRKRVECAIMIKAALAE